jgi:RimJ/RimL family protein N-acetyltransferase
MPGSAAPAEPTPPRLTHAGELLTARLLLRRFRPSDEPALAAINADPEVTRYLNRRVGPAASRAFYASALDHWATHGFGFWAAESIESDTNGHFLGFIGLGYATFLPQLAQRVEVGWRLARSAWGRGLATEGALAARDHALHSLRLPELISVIDPENERSRRVAAKLGMTVAELVVNPVTGREVEVWQLSPARAAPSTPPGPA